MAPFDRATVEGATSVPPREPESAKASQAGPADVCDDRCWSVGELEAALDLHQFEASYQAQFDLMGNMFVGAEVLARWAHPVYGTLQPSQFIGALERGGLMGRFSETMLRIAYADTAQLRQKKPALKLALNLASASLFDDDLAQRLAKITADAGVSPKQVTVELPAAAVRANIRKAVSVITVWRMQGFQVALDDFGPGSFSLAQLCALPVNELRISRAIVASEPIAGTPWPLVELLLVCKRLGLNTSAKGIERAGQRNLLRTLGCNTGQGFFFSMPMNQLALHRWLDDHPETLLVADEGHSDRGHG
jgi:EAL domain-containing protein (putative c-di-GMP-specific phosphodiesterase class I)